MLASSAQPGIRTIVQNQQRLGADIAGSEKRAINTKIPSKNVGYIVVVRKLPSVIHLIVLNQRKIFQLSNNV